MCVIAEIGKVDVLEYLAINMYTVVVCDKIPDKTGLITHFKA